MSLQLNQFNQIPVQGELDLNRQPGTISCVVKSDEATPLVPGQAVKIVDEAGALTVTASTADTDLHLGTVNYNFKRNLYAASESVEISVINGGNVQWMTASAAIAKGAQVMAVIVSQKVATATSNKAILGYALDKASADGDLIRVMMLPKASLAS